ncbi:MAG: Helix-turn-helix, AraC protein [Gemmatimonadetes bacterium]|nr:Helix-turn-helix, AraC protein [Gemmatimonadota bacterium]
MTAPAVQVSSHPWSAALGVQLDSWATTGPTLVVLTGGKAILSASRGVGSFSEQVRSACTPRRHPHSAGGRVARALTCTVLRFAAGVDATMVPQHGAALVVQLHPVALFRLLCQRRNMRLGIHLHGSAFEDEALALLRHVLFRAWPCGQSRTPASSARQARHRSLAFEAQAMMSSEPSARHTMQELAATLEISPFHLAHVFRSQIGISLQQYRLQLRIVAALERLAEGEPDLSKLALDLGFSHHSHFSSQFLRAVGCSPRDIRHSLTAKAGSGLAPRQLSCA